MNFLILDKPSAMRFTSPLRYAIISITDVDGVPPCFQDGAVAILRVSFCDIDTKNDRFPRMTGETARQILEFVDQHKDLVDLFIVHCNAGIGRSPGVTAGLCFVFNKDDTWVFKQKPFANKHVYKTILQEALKMGLI